MILSLVLVLDSFAFLCRCWKTPDNEFVSSIVLNLAITMTFAPTYPLRGYAKLPFRSLSVVVQGGEDQRTLELKSPGTPGSEALKRLLASLVIGQLLSYANVQCIWSLSPPLSVLSVKWPGRSMMRGGPRGIELR
ncbi:hypothetical protein B0H65DRAFT_12777 [Neurospora tetraspora]|uniref:Uncharacterized protein n=1 Tax=Neurospora tetraspora TaxID=94610 RepID=A0AAE0JMQ4_9PEZI|nr:hypothetical protein B0H65DRAFT_12777 [Neurospora tetraspora]